MRLFFQLSSVELPLPSLYKHCLSHGETAKEVASISAHRPTQQSDCWGKKSKGREQGILMGKAAVVYPPGMPLWRPLAGCKVPDLSLCCLVSRLTFGTSPRKRSPAGNMGHAIRRIRLLKKPSNSVTASVCQWCVLDSQGAMLTMHNCYKMYDHLGQKQ